MTCVVAHSSRFCQFRVHDLSCCSLTSMSSGSHSDWHSEITPRSLSLVSEQIVAIFKSEGEFPPVSARRRVRLVRARGWAMSCAGQTPRYKDIYRSVLPPLGVRLKIPFCCFRRCSSHTHAISWTQALISRVHMFLYVLFLRFPVESVIHVLGVATLALGWICIRDQLFCMRV